MRPANLGMGQAFRTSAAAISPMNAFSCVASLRDRRHPLSPDKWMARGASDLASVKKSLELQLGARWNGLACETDVRRALLWLLAVVSLDGGGRLLAAVNRTAVAGGDILATVRKETSCAMKEIERVVAARSVGHGWSGTVACEMVSAAKSGTPVLPSSYFLWMSGIDRDLWLLVNNHGRHESFVEVAGIRAHHQAETVMGRALEEPFFDNLAKNILDSSQLPKPGPAPTASF